MTFSIRAFLIVISILAAWLGAMVSNSLLAVELVGNLTTLLIVLTLAFAIWDRRPEQRVFWTGFFLLGIANLALGNYYSAYQQTSAKVATLILGEPNSVSGAMPYAVPAGAAPVYPTTTVTYYAQSPRVLYQTPAPPYGIQMPADYFVQHQAINAAVPSLLSLVMGCIGGYLTLWVWRQKTEVDSAQSVRPTAPPVA